MRGHADLNFREELADPLRWRRDVRRQRSDPVAAAVLSRCLNAFALAPAVGRSEPWRLVHRQSPAAGAAALANFETANSRAPSGDQGAQAQLYAGLKLSGMREAPVQRAVFGDETTAKGGGLGAATLAKTLANSVVGAITLFWLTARAEGLWLGWVSILDPVALRQDLNTPADWKLIGDLCLGRPEASDDRPELERVGWETRAATLWMETR